MNGGWGGWGGEESMRDLGKSIDYLLTPCFIGKRG